MSQRKSDLSDILGDPQYFNVPIETFRVRVRLALYLRAGVGAMSINHRQYFFDGATDAGTGGSRPAETSLGLAFVF